MITEIHVGSKNLENTKDGSTPVIVYKFEGITEEEAQKICEELLTNPVTQEGTVNPVLDRDTIEISYKPGVMNPVEESLLRGSKNLGITPIAVGTSRIYFVDDNKHENFPLSQVEEILSTKGETLILDTETPHVEIVEINNLDKDDLNRLSKERSLFLDVTEMEVIQMHFTKLGRNPTDIEIETIAQTWSEHNGHKTFKSKLITPEGTVKKSAISRIKETSQKYFEKVGVKTAFSDNSGGISFYDGYVIIAKGETHNSPVAIEPVGGSETKVGGLYRDIAGTGSGGKNLFAIVVNNFGNPNTQKDEVNIGCLHPKTHLDGNTKGESSYGNKMGIPTLGAIFHFDQTFGPKPTSMGIAVGIIEEEYVKKGKPETGDLLITVGGKTGKDGIHGATFSSGEMDTKTNTVHQTAVQMGNALEEKRMFDALQECKYAGVIKAITDCGGGGYSSAIGEIGEQTGIEVNLDKVPLKYLGLAPWEIWLSESQERMVLAIDPRNWEKFKEICTLYEVPADIIGKFTNDKKLKLKYKDELVGELSMQFLHSGFPKKKLAIIYQRIEDKNETPDYPRDWPGDYKKVLGHPNICSKEPIFRRYDHTVGGRTVLSPLFGVNHDIQPDASVIAPIYGKPYGVITSCALNPYLTGLDPYLGTIWTMAEAAVKYISVGGDIKNAAAIDNYVWPANTPYTLGALDKSIEALTVMLDILQIPVVSGKDSLSSTYIKNDGTKIEIPYTLNFTLFGKIPDISTVITPEFKKVGSIICLVGETYHKNMGGSIYFDTHKKRNTNIPKVNLSNFSKVLDTVQDAMKIGKIKSCKAIGEGGLAVALAQMCFASGIGASIDLGVFDVRPDFAFYNETPAFLVELEKIDDPHVLKDLPHRVIGITTKEPAIKITNQISTLCKINLEELRKAWQWKY